MSFSGEMPFSRARAVMASRISRDMVLVLLGLDEVGSGDGVVRDGDDAGCGSDRHLRIGSSHELAGERLVAVELLARADAGTTTDEPPEVVRLARRALGAGGRHGEPVLLQQLRQRVRDALAELERDAVGMVDVELDVVTLELREQHLDLGLALGELALDLSLDGGAHQPSPLKMKERAIARSLYIIGGVPPTRKLWLENSSMDAPEHDVVGRVTAFLQGVAGPFPAVAAGPVEVPVHRGIRSSRCAMRSGIGCWWPWSRPRRGCVG